MEFSDHRLDIRFVHHDVPEEVDEDVSTCIFRIVQEGLRNVLKHSGSANATVELSGLAERLELCVSTTS